MLEALAMAVDEVGIARRDLLGREAVAGLQVGADHDL
jgi:hypothetical protein